MKARSGSADFVFNIKISIASICHLGRDTDAYYIMKYTELWLIYTIFRLSLNCYLKIFVNMQNKVTQDLKTYFKSQLI